MEAEAAALSQSFSSASSSFVLSWGSNCEDGQRIGSEWPEFRRIPPGNGRGRRTTTRTTTIRGIEHPDSSETPAARFLILLTTQIATNRGLGRRRRTIRNPRSGAKPTIAGKRARTKDDEGRFPWVIKKSLSINRDPRTPPASIETARWMPGMIQGGLGAFKS
jgi:hypothetical protein